MAKSILGDINPVESSDESTNRDRISDDLDRDPKPTSRWWVARSTIARGTRGRET